MNKTLSYVPTVVGSFAVVGLSMLLLSGCAAALGDAQDSQGNKLPPNELTNLDWISVHRNVDGMPNIAMVCANGFGFATTSTPSGEASSGGGNFQRLPELDAFCAGKS